MVAGQKAKIQQTVSLTAAAGPVAQRERVTLSLSATPFKTMIAPVIASASLPVHLKAGQSVKLSLSAKQIPPYIAPGTYHVLVSVAAPTGPETTVDTGKTMTVHAAPSKPSRK